MASNDPTTRGGPQQNQRKNPTAKKQASRKQSNQKQPESPLSKRNITTTDTGWAILNRKLKV